jgi:asparagine synthase (glutamine-hydrolysing)
LQNYSPENVMLSLSQQYSNEEVQQFLSKQFEILSTAYDGKNLQKKFYTPLSYMLAVDYQTYLPDDILQKVDRATMAFSLEGREPFLDHRVIEWAAQLPDTYKYHKGEKKYILKQIVHKYVPQQMMERPKTGFAVPIAQWLEKELKPLVEKHLNKASLEKSEVLNPETVQKILDAFYSGRKEYDAKLWNLLMFQMWYDKWMR